uniref:Uncharacterized protein n=1 Tax=Globodera rostochiensis TaxID=31243 RepID=A0A914H6M1_GLORO
MVDTRAPGQLDSGQSDSGQLDSGQSDSEDNPTEVGNRTVDNTTRSGTSCPDFNDDNTYLHHTTYSAQLYWICQQVPTTNPTQKLDVMRCPQQPRDRNEPNTLSFCSKDGATCKSLSHCATSSSFDLGHFPGIPQTSSHWTTWWHRTKDSSIAKN